MSETFSDGSNHFDKAKHLNYFPFQNNLLHTFCEEKFDSVYPFFLLSFELLEELQKIIAYEPRHEKTNILHMRKQRRRSASR